ncbi:hypothetical protein [Methanosarcina sp.]|uniref:hypothetical protein n=1 Tax=Methanosarcina sp. TaxID=2213 RepID=UPI002ABB14F0|nr:hypothetical protein [Methanosarcina sp.]MDY9926458.1 hypothetical protein [Methanosarcina sp.]
MRIKVLAAAGLILLGIVVFSIYLGSNNESVPDDKGIIQKIEVKNSSFLEVSEDWDGFETVIIDADKLRKAADNGNVTLNVMEEDFEVEIQEKSRLEGENAYYYTGPVAGSKQSRAELYIEGENLSGSVELGEPWNVTYNIAHTDERYDGKIVHIVFMIDWEKERERLEQEEIDPLQFFLINSDSRKHVISIEIFDFNNKSIFKETYTLGLEDEISSPKIDAELGQYRYEIILDNESTFEQKAQADHVTNLCSSEKLYITLIDHPEYPMEIGIEVA